MDAELDAFHASLRDEFHRRLLDARRGLLLTATSTEEELHTLEAHQPGAPVEDAAADAEAALVAGIEGRERHAIEDVDDALIRLASGTYGLCQRCGRAMGLARLRAMPAARYCLACQRVEEVPS